MTITTPDRDGGRPSSHGAESDFEGMSMSPYLITRRGFFGAASAAGAVTWVASRYAEAQQGGLRVRKNIKTLTAQEIASLERGVSVMKQRPKESPLSWDFQARIHGFVQGEEQVVYYGWATCQHGNWWFLPWHRAYLYFFEQILRDASGDPNLTLPYWDWTKPDQLALPEPFLNPNSPLYDASRTSDAIDESAVRWEEALAEVLFASPDPQQGRR